MRLAVIGHSHIECMRRAYASEPGRHRAQFRFLQLRDPLLYAPPASGERLRRDVDTCDLPRLQQAIAELGPLDLALLLPRGNEHNAVALVDIGVPAERLHKRIRMRMRTQYAPWLALLADTVSTPVAILLPPPPVGSEEHIRRYPNVFLKHLRNGAVSPLAMRLDAWQLQLRRMRRHARDFGVPVLDLPESVQDKESALAPSCYAEDPVHANETYGHALLDHIESNARTLISHARAHPRPSAVLTMKSLERERPVRPRPARAGSRLQGLEELSEIVCDEELLDSDLRRS